MRNAMTIDVEEYFQVAAFGQRIAPHEWEHWPSRIEYAMNRLLEMLAERQVHATFFTLGWVAERHPALIRQLVASGHELASHGYAHQRIGSQSQQQFRTDVAKSRTLLEQTGASPVLGYRAPSFSIDTHTTWAWDILQEVGYRYSSSVYPIRHDHYGMPQAPRTPWRPCHGSALLELPISTIRRAGTNFPAGGGGYFRLLPYPLSRWSIRQINHQLQQPAIFYLHPWELDPAQPRVAGLPVRNRLRHYLNLRRTEGRYRQLLADFEWGRIDQVYAAQLQEQRA